MAWRKLLLEATKYMYIMDDYGISQSGVWHLQTADRRLQAADCRLHNAARLLIEWNQKYRNKGGVINITLFRKVRPRSEVYIFHANYTDLILKGAVGCSFRIELE